MTKYEFKKFPIAATVFTLVGLLAAVLAITISLMAYEYQGGVVFLALLEILATVLVLAGLTTGKIGLLRVISIITSICVVLATFILAIVKYEVRDAYLFSTSILMFIASVLELVYFFCLKNPRIKKLYEISSISFCALTGIYAVIYIVFDVIKMSKNGSMLHPYYYAIIISFMLVALLPYLIVRSIQEVEVKNEPIDNQEPEQIN